MSERAFQLERGPQWDKGKAAIRFGPVGPRWLVTADEVRARRTCPLWLDVNSQRMQTGHTCTMILAAKLVSYVSQFMTLIPGDILTTGTPPGVGMGHKPPRYLRPGDVMTLGIGAWVGSASRSGSQNYKVRILGVC